MTPEKRVQTAIINYIKKLKESGYCIDVRRTQAGGFSYHKGEPDLHIIYRGEEIDCEVKAPGKDLRPMQKKWAERCEKEWHKKYICADNVDIVKTKLKEWYDVE